MLMLFLILVLKGECYACQVWWFDWIIFRKRVVFLYSCQSHSRSTNKHGLGNRFDHSNGRQLYLCTLGWKSEDAGSHQSFDLVIFGMLTNQYFSPVCRDVYLLRDHGRWSQTLGRQCKNLNFEDDAFKFLLNTPV